MNQELTTYPHSAIATWGGFLYQGKIALYHCIKLLIEKSFNEKPLNLFELQLDSTDDFAIYNTGKAISTHQVKAKLDKYSANYKDALEQASNVNQDCDTHTIRYFHVANELDSFEPYKNKDGDTVIFYEYDQNHYCKLDNVDDLIEKKISEYMEKNHKTPTKILLTEKLCILSELITKKILENHSKIHAGRKKNEVAYNERILSSEITEILESDHRYHTDKEYRALNIKRRFCHIIEKYVYDYLEEYSNNILEIISKTIGFINTLSINDICCINSSLQPDIENFEAHNKDIIAYIDVITKLDTLPQLINLPHYSITSEKILPTSIRLNNDKRKNKIFLEDMIENIKNDDELAILLYEYNTLIAAESDCENQLLFTSEKITENIKVDEETNIEKKSNIVKQYTISIVTTDAAKEKLK